jgi:hypothetical protein
LTTTDRIDGLAEKRRPVLRPDDDADRDCVRRRDDLAVTAHAFLQIAEWNRTKLHEIHDVIRLGILRRRRQRHRAIGIEAACVSDVVARLELRLMLCNRCVLVLRDFGDINECGRPERMAHFVERDTGHGKIGEERRIGLHQLAENA